MESKNPSGGDVELYHVSEEAGIAQFAPRMPPNASSGIDRPVVWAVDQRRLHNYLLPRDCPRVTFFAKSDSSPADVQRLIGPSASPAVVAIEAGWLKRAKTCTLYLYTFTKNGFVLIDDEAGYWVNHNTVNPLAATEVSDCIGAIVKRGVELRVVANLWPLRDAVVNSTIGFSCIRMHNALPRDGCD